MNPSQPHAFSSSPHPAAMRKLGTMRIEPIAPAEAQHPTRKAFLNVIHSQADLGLHHLVEQPTVLGRNPEVAVPLHDFGVSWQHALITPHADGNYVLTDLQSTNGTWVDGKLIREPHVLKNGERIVVGATVIRFSLADEMEIGYQHEVATSAGTDALTGLPSKSRFDQAARFALQHAARSEGALTMLMMDMDGVKQINDRHGHLFGAHVIGETGRLIARVVGTRGMACRFGGDEFCAVLPGLPSIEAISIAEQIRHSVENAGMTKDEVPLTPTISIGVAGFPESGSRLEELVEVADKALYRAKAAGKNRVCT